MVETILHKINKGVIEQTDPSKLLGIQMAQLVPKIYDYIALTYTGDNLTKVEYYNGGAGGELVATLILNYTGDQLDTITRS